MRVSYTWLLLLLSCLLAAPLAGQDSLLYKSPTLVVERIAPGTYLHRSYLTTREYGKVACNGVIFTDGPAAVVFDTPPDTASSRELLDVLQQELRLTVTAVVPTHFHVDCLGGLAEFHRRGIPSYASQATIDLARSHEFSVPQNAFDQQLTLPVGALSVDIRFPGPGHSSDNCVAYFPTDRVLFGGCLIKAAGAKKGNLEDADVKSWATTCSQLMELYPTAQRVVPGHGRVGDLSLVDYTRRLFTKQ